MILHSDNMNRKCDKCGNNLEHSQYAKGLNPDGTPLKSHEGLVCRNYPKCPLAEKEIKSNE